MNTQPTKSGRRQPAYDLLRFVAIFLVLWCHSIQYLVHTQPYDEPLYRIICSFNMPLFMTLAGYFSLSSMRLSFQDMIVKKARQLLLPCLTFAVVFWLSLSVLPDLLNHRPLTLNILGQSLLFSLWFLKSLFVCYVVAWLVEHAGRWRRLLLALTLVGCLWVIIYDLWRMYPCFIFGMMMQRNKGVVDLAHRYRYCFLVLFVAALPFLGSDFFNGHLIEDTRYVGLRLVRVAMGFLGVMTIYGMAATAWFRSLARRLPHCCVCGRYYTLGIYIVQTILLENLLPIVLNCDGLPFVVFNIVVCPFVSLIVLVVSMMIIDLINRHDLTATLAFGHRFHREPTAQ